MSASTSRLPKRSRPLDDDGASGGGSRAPTTRARLQEGGSLFAPAADDSDEEPLTEDEEPDFDVATPDFDLATPAAVVESDPEPDTEEDDEPLANALVPPRVPPTNNIPRTRSVVNLSSDDDDDEAGPSARPAPRPCPPTRSAAAAPRVLGGVRREGASTFTSVQVPSDSEDEDDVVQVRDKGKGKGKAKATGASTSNSPAPGPSVAAAAPATKENLEPSLSTLSCPICLGAPTPLALTSCGHAFCAPCLHAALLAGGSPTPPPQTARRGAFGGLLARGSALFGPGSSRGARGRGTTLQTLGGTGRGRGAATPAPAVVEEEEESELDGHCPVCRTVLRGGWGRSIRGVTMRMVPVKKADVPPLELD